MSALVAELQLMRDGQVVHTEPMGPNALFIGRAPDNDLILNDSRISGRHAVLHLSTDRTQLVLRDLGSTNGTFVNGEAARGVTVLTDGDELVLGSSVHLRVHLTLSHHAAPPPPGPTLLVDLGSGVVTPVRGSVLRVGPGEGCQVQLSDLPEDFAAALTIHEAEGEITLATEDGDQSLVVGEPFTIGQHQLVFRDSQAALAATRREAGEAADPYPYALTVVLTPPEATVVDRVSGRRHTVTAENRVSLLYVLARQRLADLQDGTLASRAGWCSDDQVMSGIWGRGWDKLGANNYQVLLSRVRKELRKAGLDGWFIEKRRGHTRVRLQQVALPE